MSSTVVNQRDFNICRLCLNHSTDLLNIFSSTTSYTSISAAIMECAPVQITLEDSFPKFICSSCIPKLDNAYQFRIMCVESDLALRRINGEIKEEPNETIPTQHCISELHEMKEEPNDAVNDPSLISTNITSLLDKNEYKIEVSDDEFDNEPLSIVKELLVTFKKENKKASKSKKYIRKNTNGLYKCRSCDRSFRMKHNMFCHEKACMKKRDQQMEDVEYFGAQPSRMKRTRVSYKKRFDYTDVMPDENGRFTCPTCNANYKSKYHLRRHQIVHSDFRYRCDECGMEFLRQRSMDNHKRRHTGERSFSCEFCGKTFRHETALRNHRRIHLGIRPYKCSICDKTFTQNKTLKNHMRTHTGERPFVCETCGRSFNRKHHLTTHNMIHTGEKRFSCEVCNQQFSLKQHLNLHKAKHTGKPRPVWSCVKCKTNFGQKCQYEKHLKMHYTDSE